MNMATVKNMANSEMKHFNDCYTGLKVPESRLIQGADGPFDAERIVENCEFIYDAPLSMDSPHNATDVLSGVTIDRRNALNIIYAFDKAGIPKWGYTSKQSVLYAVFLKKRTSMPGGQYNVPLELFRELELEESLFDGIFYEKGSNFNPSPKPVKYQQFPFPNPVQKLITNKGTREEKLKYGMISSTYHIPESKRYTFGVEIETSGGRIPTQVREDLSMKCVYDGSIRDSQGNKGYGGEYVSGIFTGDNGFRHLYKIVSELSKRCSINNTCSIHVHLGGIRFTKETAVMIWKLGQMLEDELFTMMPKSRQTRPHCSRIRKLSLKFNEKMPYNMIIDKYYNMMFKIVSLGHNPSKTVNKSFSHPAGHSCGWDTSTPRYWWLNFVPLMFNLKGEENYTIEYRMHSATLNYTKIKNWILICMGMLYVASNHQRILMKKNSITLNEVMDLAYPSKSEYLKGYILERKEKFSPDLDENLAEKYEYVVNRNAFGKDVVTIRDVAWE